MSTVTAWKFIIDNWHTSTWTPLPNDVRDALHFDSRVGLCSGMLVSKAGASGVNEFVNRLNAKQAH